MSPAFELASARSIRSVPVAITSPSRLSRAASSASVNSGLRRSYISLRCCRAARSVSSALRRCSSSVAMMWSRSARDSRCCWLTSCTPSWAAGCSTRTMRSTSRSIVPSRISVRAVAAVKRRKTKRKAAASFNLMDMAIAVPSTDIEWPTQMASPISRGQPQAAAEAISDRPRKTGYEAES